MSPKRILLHSRGKSLPLSNSSARLEYDHKSGSIIAINAYGEYSYNGKPIFSDSLNKVLGKISKIPFDPSNPPSTNSFYINNDLPIFNSQLIEINLDRSVVIGNIKSTTGKSRIFRGGRLIKVSRALHKKPGKIRLNRDKIFSHKINTVLTGNQKRMLELYLKGSSIREISGQFNLPNYQVQKEMENIKSKIGKILAMKEFRSTSRKPEEKLRKK